MSTRTSVRRTEAREPSVHRTEAREPSKRTHDQKDSARKPETPTKGKSSLRGTRIIYTDGSALGNAKNAFAGWACYFSDIKVLRSGAMRGTNNQAELHAISYALWYSLHAIPDMPKRILIKSDSKYSIGVVSGEMKAKANLEKLTGIWKLKDGLLEKGCEVRFQYVPAHTGGTSEEAKLNDLVDRTARGRAEELAKSGLDE